MSRYVSPSSRFSAVAPPGPMLDSDAVGVTYWQVLRVRYLASGMWWVRWKSKKGFKKENGNLLRCQLQRRFFKSDSSRLHTSSMNTCKNLTFFFYMTFIQLWNCLGKLDLLKQNIFSGEMRGNPPSPEVSIGMDKQNMCAKCHGLSPKNSTDI